MRFLIALLLLGEAAPVCTPMARRSRSSPQPENCERRTRRRLGELARELKRAQIVRAPTSLSAIELFVKERLEVVAGVRQPLVGYARIHPGYRVMDGRFQGIEQAMGTPRGRPAGARYLREFVEEMKSSGFVERALK